MNKYWFIPNRYKEKIKIILINMINKSRRVIELEKLAKSSQIKITQLEESLRLNNKIITPPPEKLQTRIVGGFYNDFVSSGYRNIRDFNLALSKYGKHLFDFRTVLDFGCGCGRVFMALHNTYPDIKISGSDIDSEAINYCQTYLGHIGSFMINNTNAPSLFEDNTFDFIYGISVFTHLPELNQNDWLNDLHRISKSGAYLILTIENEKIQSFLRPNQLKEFLEKGIYFIDFGKTQGLPNYYGTTFHTHDYVKEVWGNYFEILDIIPRGSEDHQDLVICKKR